MAITRLCRQRVESETWTNLVSHRQQSHPIYGSIVPTFIDVDAYWLRHSTNLKHRPRLLFLPVNALSLSAGIMRRPATERTSDRRVDPERG